MSLHLCLPDSGGYDVRKAFMAPLQGSTRRGTACLGRQEDLFRAARTAKAGECVIS